VCIKQSGLWCDLPLFLVPDVKLVPQIIDHNEDGEEEVETIDDEMYDETEDNEGEEE